MPNGFLPNTGLALRDWSRNFGNRISADPQGYGLTVQQAADYRQLHETFVAALGACEPKFRTMGNTAAKNESRDSLKQLARRLVTLINGQAHVTEAQRIDLGLTVRSRPKRAAVPDQAPIVIIRGVLGNRVSVRLSSETYRAKPHGAIGATLFSFVGEEPPARLDGWQFAGNFGSSAITCTFPSTVSGGALVWIKACWLNSRLQSGPCSAPRSTYLQGAILEKRKLHAA